MSDFAIASIVNCHYRQPLAQRWGGGTLSSSDGQRSNQVSQYGSKPIFSTVRDATYVLDGILDNEAELSIAEHTSDTAGYTEGRVPGRRQFDSY